MECNDRKPLDPAVAGNCAIRPSVVADLSRHRDAPSRIIYLKGDFAVLTAAAEEGPGFVDRGGVRYRLRPAAIVVMGEGLHLMTHRCRKRRL